MALDLIARLRMIDNLSAPMRRAMGTASSFATKLTGVGSAVAGLAAGLGAAKVATSSFSKALDFEAQMSSIKALTGATTAQMAKMDELALTMGSKTKYSALQAAAGIEELLKAGITPAAVQSGALEAALNLATAGGLELASAAEIMSTALNAYKKDGMSAATASDILAGTANASATGVEDLRQSLASVSAVAAGIGMTFKDTNAALGLFANNGVKGSDAGTSLKTMLQNLQPTTKDQITLFNRLGITTKGTANRFFTAQGKLQSLDKVTGVLHDSLKNLNDMQRQAALEVMFGTDAVRAGTILYNEGADGVKKFYNEMGNVSALQVATEKMNNGRGAIEQFKGALETLQIKAIKPLLPAIKAAFNGLGDYVNAKTPEIEAAVKRMTKNVSSYIKTHFTENKDFTKLPDNMAKFKFVIEDFQKTFDAWYLAGGDKQISDAVNGLVAYAGSAFSTAAPALTSIGVDMGKAIGGGMLEGMKQFAASNPLLAAITAFIVTPGTPQVRAAAALAAGAVGVIEGHDIKQQQRIDSQYDFIKRLDAAPAGVPVFGGGDLVDPNKTHITSSPSSGHAGGLDRVPYNGYSARLHKDETVLTKTEADARRDNRGASGGVTISGNTFHVRKESDIHAIASELADMISTAKGARSIG
jgi:TP901 family phage tail tape measure protein